MVIYLEKNVIDGIQEDMIKKIIDKNPVSSKYEQLLNYYTGKHNILSESKSDTTAPNNKIVANMAKYITDTATGYFIGKPVIYSSQNASFIKELQEVYDYNDEQDNNAEIAKACSIYGHCFEMLYIDEDSRIRFQKIDPQSIIMIYEAAYTNPIAAIRAISSTDIENKVTKYYDFWTANEVWHFKANGDKLELQTVEEHFWNDVPFVEYINNEERIGDFEGVLSIIDAYNRAQSNSANLFQYNDEAILKITKMGAVTSSDVKEMKEQGAIILDDGGSIDWLLKVIDDTALENHKKRLREDMHIFSSVPNLTDEAFGGNLSGVAVSYKLWGLEQMCAMKERKLKRGLQRRIELIAAILNMTAGSYSYMDIDIQFRRNKPQNILEIAQIITMLASELSRETRLKMLPTVDNVQDELDKLEAEKQKALGDFGSFDSLAKALNDTTMENTP